MRGIKKIWTLIAGITLWQLAALTCLAEAETGVSYPDAGRFAKQVQAFVDSEDDALPPAKAIVAVGSSSMRGWHKTILDDLSPLSIIPRGFGGSNMHDLLYFVDDLVIRHKPRAVMIYEGDNDIAGRITPGKVAATFDAVVERIHSALPETRIYMLSVKPSIFRWAIWPEMAETNLLLSARCDDNPLLTYIDIASPMLNEQGEPKPEIFMADMLHMNDRGYRLWTAAVRPILIEKEGPSEESPTE